MFCRTWLDTNVSILGFVSVNFIVSETFIQHCLSRGWVSYCKCMSKVSGVQHKGFCCIEGVLSPGAGCASPWTKSKSWNIHWPHRGGLGVHRGGWVRIELLSCWTNILEWWLCLRIGSWNVNHPLSDFWAQNLISKARGPCRHSTPWPGLFEELWDRQGPSAFAVRIFWELHLFIFRGSDQHPMAVCVVYVCV